MLVVAILVIYHDHFNDCDDYVVSSDVTVVEPKIDYFTDNDNGLKAISSGDLYRLPNPLVSSLFSRRV